MKQVIKHLDGREIVINSPSGKVVEHGDIKIVNGEGMPKFRAPFEKGRLFIIFKVVFPKDNFCEPKGLAMLRKFLPYSIVYYLDCCTPLLLLLACLLIGTCDSYLAAFVGHRYPPAPIVTDEQEVVDLEGFDQDRDAQPGARMFSGKSANSAYDEDERGGGGMGGPGGPGVQCANQ